MCGRSRSICAFALQPRCYRAARVYSPDTPGWRHRSPCLGFLGWSLWPATSFTSRGTPFDVLELCSLTSCHWHVNSCRGGFSRCCPSFSVPRGPIILLGTHPQRSDPFMGVILWGTQPHNGGGGEYSLFEASHPQVISTVMGPSVTLATPGFSTDPMTDRLGMPS